MTRRYRVTVLTRSTLTADLEFVSGRESQNYFFSAVGKHQAELEN